MFTNGHGTVKERSWNFHGTERIGKGQNEKTL
jgi:hypothetical protein